MTKFRTIGIMLSAITLFSLNSCDNDDSGDATGEAIIGTGDVNDVIIRNGTTSSLEAALKIAPGDLPGTLQGEGPFTVFAPTNAAFDALGAEIGVVNGDSLLKVADPAVLGQILTYHVVAGKLEASGFVDGDVLATVNGGEITANVDGEGNVSISDAAKLPETNPVGKVLSSNSAASNGIVHFIDKVLLPASAIEALAIDIRPTILDQASASEDLTTLVSALKKADLVDTVAALDSVNVLAPNNKAFEDFLELLGPDYKSLDDFDNATEIALLGDVLKYHVLLTETLVAGETATALDENTIETVAISGGFAFTDASGTDATVLSADIEAKNGNVQVVDRVLLPQAAIDFLALLNSGDLANVVTRTPQLSILEEALAATKLVPSFVDATNESFVQGEDEEDDAFLARSTPANFTYFKPATVFAPTNAAFEQLFELLGDDYSDIASFETEAEIELLSEILLYHVIQGKTASADLEAGTVTTVAESDITFISVVGSDEIVIGDASNDDNAQILIADVEARNGIGHVIDKVLLPKSAIDFIVELNEEEDTEE